MADRTFRVMGGRARLSVDDDAAHLLDGLVDAAHALESRWSRFLPDSEVSRLNQFAGAPAVVSHDTAALVDASRRAHAATGGWFDPMMLREIEAVGYRHSFELIGRFGTAVAPPEGDLLTAIRRPSIRDVDVDLGIGLVHLPAGAAFDPGGIGKGFAADCLAERALSEGAGWVIADVGGDIRVAGEDLAFGEFRIEVAHPGGGTLCTVAVSSGAAATSGTLRRRWRAADGSHRHHLIDPTTGVSARSDLATVTVLAAEAWWAESAATAAVVAGRSRGLAMLDDRGLPAIAIDEGGEVHLVGNIEAFIL